MELALPTAELLYLHRGLEVVLQFKIICSTKPGMSSAAIQQ
jgi:hypothetical protein